MNISSKITLYAVLTKNKTEVGKLHGKRMEDITFAAWCMQKKVEWKNRELYGNIPAQKFWKKKTSEFPKEYYFIFFVKQKQVALERKKEAAAPCDAEKEFYTVTNKTSKGESQNNGKIISVWRISNEYKP